MAFSTYMQALPAVALAVADVAAQLRLIQSSSGDLTILQIAQAQSGLERAKLAAVSLIEEGAKAPAATEAMMAEMGGPSTLAEFGAGMVAIEAAAATWNAALDDALQASPGWSLVTRPQTDTRHPEPAQFVPAAIAEPLRQTQALADLIAAFDAAGA